MAEFVNSLAAAQALDAADPLKSYRDRFYIPTFHEKAVRYFTGNSLGLQPKSAQTYVQQEMDDWAKWGVEGHFHGKNPWFSYHEFLTEKAARVVGALPKEVVVTHSLTTNLHLLMVSFYRPTGTRTKILCEAKAFPSDLYALESQVRFHGLNPDVDLIALAPRDGEHLLREEDVLAKIAELDDTLALVMIGGVNYYTGQLMDMPAITKAGHAVGAIVGFDLAHAAGNIHLKLHEWDVDFAAWCSYKYLNSGPGGVSGMYVHERFANRPDLPRFAGWWGYDKSTRFQMEPGFKPMEGAEGWQLSNAPVISMAVHWASLEIYDEVGMERLNEKTVLLTGYLEFILDELTAKYQDQCRFEIITPREKHRRGAQLSILVHGKGKALFDALSANGVVADWREPNVIRVAPVPLYNSFEDVYYLGKFMEEAILG
ncbi:MAG: kynureninase [Candidatus Fluviicola riflensis]|nr:MAG: kynureninase [Candidatus Fluviicola riflensis]OGS78233.1 MAG: kynureninase [Candidatus Fluviicola riflensis]OGS85299.1 MAG: kynureninase [Fluviicola sp. RIFCSPHIGHO2_01_FULL_43_53]OGS87341.1 MAG: kynureninase [Fluviicola sp. RIFCSPHIGHO2_12_FULL_43_24]